MILMFFVNILIPLILIAIIVRWAVLKWIKVDEDKRSEIIKRKEEIKKQDQLYNEIKDIDIDSIKEKKDKVSKFLEDTEK